MGEIKELHVQSMLCWTRTTTLVCGSVCNSFCRWPVCGRDDSFLPVMQAMMQTELRFKPGKWLSGRWPDSFQVVRKHWTPPRVNVQNYMLTPTPVWLKCVCCWQIIDVSQLCFAEYQLLYFKHFFNAIANNAWDPYPQESRTHTKKSTQRCGPNLRQRTRPHLPKNPAKMQQKRQRSERWLTKEPEVNNPLHSLSRSCFFLELNQQLISRFT